MDAKAKYELLGEAIRLAERFHRHQRDLEGEPLILHLFRVANRVKEDVDAMIVAMLHDIVEDTEVSITEIKNKFPEDISKAVRLLTHLKTKITYDAYIENLLPNELARKVKKADLGDNLDPHRLVFIRQGLNKLGVNSVNWIFEHIKAYQRILDYEEELKIEQGKPRQIKSS